jgi:type II secretory ATPase GspE/PulE/Tfp pilus assembly ATPase PilB-like protein
MTLEQPIEYRVNGIRQTEIHENGIISFADGVRSMLRHDPDIMLIGEIRDEDTAKMALRASMTGHLVLATLHASCPFVTPARLIDLGITPNLLSGQILAILSQKLIRTPKGRKADGELVVFTDEMHQLIGDGGNSSKLRKMYGEFLAKNKLKKQKSNYLRN